MQPEQAPPPSNDNPYTFITNPAGQVTQPGRFSGGLTDQRKRIMIVAGCAVVLIIVVLIVSSIISNAGKGNVVQLTAVVQDQAELVHICSVAPAQAVNQPTKNVTATINITMASAEKTLLALMSSEGNKVSSSQAGAKELKTTDNQINAAVQVSQYDQVFLQIMQTQINQYEKDLSAAYAAKPNAAQATILKSEYKGAGLLSTMTSSAITAIAQ